MFLTWYNLPNQNAKSENFVGLFGAATITYALEIIVLELFLPLPFGNWRDPAR